MGVTMHREAVKAQIRMRHGSLAQFATAEGLKPQQVRDLLRGKSNGAKPAVAKLLGVETDHLSITADSTNVERLTTDAPSTHRLNEVAR